MTYEDYRIPEEKKRRGLWPLWGALLLLACLAIGRVLAPLLYDFINARSPRFSTGSLTYEQFLWFLTAIIAVVLVSIITLVLAVTAPRKKLNVKERQLAKERRHDEAMRRAKKKRMRELNRKMREENRKSSG